MKIQLLIAAGFFFPAVVVFGQDQTDKPVTQAVTKITFLEPGIAHEFPMGKATSFFLRGGLTATLAYNYYDEPKTVLFRPFVSSSLRVYYNFAKRALMEKNTDRNSANYIAILAIVATPPLNKGYDYNTTYNETLINTGLVWGLQRNYRSGFSFDLNIGMGYAGPTSNLLISPVAELNIGWCLGRKN